METPLLCFDRKKEFFHMTGVGLAYFLLAGLDMVAVRGLSIILYQITGNAWLYSDWAFYSVSMLPNYLLCMPICFALLYFIRSDPPEKKRLTGTFFAIALAASFTGVEAGSLMGTWVSGFIGTLLGREVTDSVSELISSSSLGPTLLYACLLAPVLEELFFRKLLIDRTRRYGELPAVLISAIGFGLYHGNFYQFFYAVLVGLVFAYVYVKTGRVIYTVLLHMIINVTGSVIPYIIGKLVDTQQMQNLTDPGAYSRFAAENALGLGISYGYSTFLVCIAVLGFALVIALHKKITFEKGFARLPENAALQVYLLNPGVILFILLCLYFFVRSVLL